MYEWVGWCVEESLATHGVEGTESKKDVCVREEFLHTFSSQ
jgi:hypothetical protein